jgi:hypothetical protein
VDVFVVVLDAQQALPVCFEGHATVPYEQKTQQSPSRGRSSTPHPEHGWKNRHASVGMIMPSWCPQYGHITTDISSRSLIASACME